MCCVLLDLLNNKCYMEMSKTGQTKMTKMEWNFIAYTIDVCSVFPPTTRYIQTTTTITSQFHFILDALDAKRIIMLYFFFVFRNFSFFFILFWL